MKSRTKENEFLENKEQTNGSDLTRRKKKIKKKNMMRLGGSGLSLESFANLKSNNNQYNPALIKKQKEFYKNAKYVSKYKKSLKLQSQQSDLSSDLRPQKEDNEIGGAGSLNQKKNNKKKSAYSLKELYEKKHEEEEKARMEREAIIQAKKEERERGESQRKAMRQKMLKKTRFGQPVMKYRIEHLLESIQGSTKN